MNNLLHSLPFQQDAKRLSSCYCEGQGFDPPSFKLYSEADRLPTFSIRLPPIGEEPDLTYANECIHISYCDGSPAQSLTMEEAGVQIYKDSASYYIVYKGDRIPTLGLECGKCFRMRIMNYYSEVFWVTQTPEAKIKIEFSNNGQQLGDVPYQSFIVQKLLIDGEICSLDADLFENRKTENSGKETISYQRLTYRKKLTIYAAPDFISQLLASAPMHDGFKVSQGAEEIIALKKRVKVDQTQNGCCDYDIEVTLPYKDSEIIGGVCQSDTDPTLVLVDIPEDLPDSCEVDDEWTATSEVMCLKFGQVPPPIDPPITPVGTPPVGTTHPPEGRVLTNITLTVSCTNPWISGGIKYKKKITKTIADGEGGFTTELSFAEPCDLVIVTHSVSSPQCEAGLPPAGTPPVGTPPVGTPPVGTPPVGTPPVGTSPTEKYQLVLGTTGSGFDASATHGIAPEWVERIEAFNYSWGWGITGVAVWVPWDNWEPTAGNFQTAAMNRVISYLNARNLDLHIVFIARRTEGDGFITSDETVKGSDGTVCKEGPTGIYPSYGCVRTNALIYTAVAALVNVVKTYSRAGVMTLGGGTTGEFVNHVFNGEDHRELGDFCTDSLTRFNTWCTTRGLASAGTPPIIQGTGIDWPHPDWGDARGVEFGRFLSYCQKKYYKNFCDAVKSVSSLKCIYFYAAAANSQLAATSNANMNYIAAPGDGMYGSEGDGLYGHDGKVLCNSVNIGTMPNGISCVEFDPDDLSTWRYDHGTTPPYCNGNLNYGIMKSSMENLYAKGCMIIHWAMSFCPSEIAGMSEALQQLKVSYIGKTYVRPTLNGANTVEVEVTAKYRAGTNLNDGIDASTKYIKYTDNDFWGGVNPPA
ncbi:hypothetical protein DYBT9275_02779 [Dyadobacter sp. CECT 9275]|uniref:Uncharacterized protein n=1 Tax=Dyadobacter helix TaxID=2822344 RepID=A0A916N664_9BACT|nr:hypothetical protein [Dyadobacter sp. CECT 9275]CAG5001978.1 hypothetical protein DYBT9275_02779 [Dyadobacter sp. CECT 9275]